jgi:hypothetical protein
MPQKHQLFWTSSLGHFYGIFRFEDIMQTSIKYIFFEAIPLSLKDVRIDKIYQ